MRRKEFSISEQEEINQFLTGMSFGFLATEGDDGYPHLTPLNFAYCNGHIYFHGARAGQKMRELAAKKQVSFAVAKEYAIIPSYYSDPKLACPATAYFKSVHIRGTAEPIEDLNEKAEALTALMEKLQPEGGYTLISPKDPAYRPELKAVSVVRLTMDEITAKFKFGQNLEETRREEIRGKLTERGGALDAETAELMRKYCPAHKES
jgi:uncharacterized protein